MGVDFGRNGISLYLVISLLTNVSDQWWNLLKTSPNELNKLIKIEASSPCEFLHKINDCPDIRKARERDEPN